ncbi:MAG: hypothetical protein U0X75_03185 [Acidobacteriota bacterium]
MLAAIEPLTEKRLAQVHPRRTSTSFVRRWRRLIEGRFAWCRTICTHNASSFYENLPADEAFALAQRFEFVLKSASWLNMIEVEFSAVARQCLSADSNRSRNPGEEVLAVIKERNNKRIKINWQFSIEEAARTKMNRHYERVFAANSQLENLVTNDVNGQGLITLLDTWVLETLELLFWLRHIAHL